MPAGKSGEVNRQKESGKQKEGSVLNEMSLERQMSDQRHLAGKRGDRNSPLRERGGTTPSPRKLGGSTMEILFAVGILVLWFALQMWILPRFGIST
jgi:hypothetical protein